MAPPIRPAANLSQSYGGTADASRENPPSNNLWIGNVSPDVSETELKALFEKYGQVDSVTTYSSRNYAFVQFKEVEDSRSAKQGLQGVILHGHSLKIEFAKPARPCKSLWVAGISQTVSKEELENEFLKFGKIQEFRFLKDRNTAFVDYLGLEDATQALKSMNGKRIGGAQIRVDYLRSQSSKREHGDGQFPSRNSGPSDFHWMGHDSLGNHPEPNLSGSKRKHQFPSVGPQYGDAPLSKILWIRYPPTVVIEEDMLHNALILFGEIERIKTFSDKSYAFVEFRSEEEARRAKEGLQGKLFNDPRILIEYFNSEFPGGREQASEYSLHPVQMDILGLNRPVLLGNNPGHPPSLGSRGPDLYMRPPFAPHNTLEAGHGQEPVDLNAIHKLQNPSPKTLIGGPSWNRLSPTPGIVSSPSGGLNVPNRSASGPWDVFDSNQLQRESKRSRFDGALSSERSELDGHYGPHLVRNGGTSGSLTRDIAGGPGQRYTESDCIWRGLIAKGGTPVCRARCVSLGEWRAADIPDVVNCSARTGLDLLSKHYEDATGFDIVFFVPDSEEDFASYTEFLRYLGSKDRAGVAKFDDGTTLFLVPPSDFLTRVLKVSGPERLYGVVLQFPQVAPSNTAINPRSSLPQYLDPHRLNTLQTGYNSIQPEERILPLNNSRVLPEDQKMPSKAPAPTCSFPAQSVAPTTVATQAGLALTPELIATLTSLLPSNNGSGLQTASLLPTSSTLGPTSHALAGPDSMTHWKHGHQPLDSNGQPAQHFGGQINPQLQHLQAAQALPAVSNTSHFHQIMNSHSQMHDHTVNLAAISSKPVAPVIPLLSGQVSATPDIDQHYQQGSSQDVLGGQGMDNGTDTLRLYNSSVIQQSAYPVASSNQLHVNGVLQPQPYMPLPSQAEITPQSQPPQTAPPFGVIQDGAETEDDKNERYKTTLLFAANLLSRIHQPSDNQSGHGAGSH